MSLSLNQSPSYLPFNYGPYDVKPNLYKLGRDFGNDAMDSRVLQIDYHATDYRRQKLAVRSKKLDRYYRNTLAHSDHAIAALHASLASMMCDEYPDLFSRESRSNGWCLHCAMTGESLRFDPDNFYLAVNRTRGRLLPEYQSGLDALACQFQEDLCVVRVNSAGDQLVAAHLCFPNRWSLADKIGKNFTDIHRPVAGFLRGNRNPSAIVNALPGGQPYVRFAWGLSSDARLDHHPASALPVTFDSEQDPLFIRVERQILLGIPGTELLLFFIRTYYYDGHLVCRQAQNARNLMMSIESMTADTLRYKNLITSRKNLIDWLRKKAGESSSN